MWAVIWNDYYHLNAFIYANQQCLRQWGICRYYTDYETFVMFARQNSLERRNEGVIK